MIDELGYPLTTDRIITGYLNVGARRVARLARRTFRRKSSTYL